MKQMLFVLFVLAWGCSPKQFMPEKETIVIRQLLEQERKAHVQKNTDLFMSEFADGMISVNKGEVNIATLSENRERISRYFNRVNFMKWDDRKPPVIRFSDDGSLAYAIIEKQVILNYPDSTGKVVYDTTDYAWVSIYRKQDDGWKIECNISTNK
ncbi:MAG TPA: nuclear transport factor 2 family protein [Chitinophagaceae bacterium]|nr:nuclear transport factor 2 family protein [Chitinophagaceae bacterium]